MNSKMLYSKHRDKCEPRRARLFLARNQAKSGRSTVEEINKEGDYFTSFKHDNWIIFSSRWLWIDDALTSVVKRVREPLNQIKFQCLDAATAQSRRWLAKRVCLCCSIKSRWAEFNGRCETFCQALMTPINGDERENGRNQFNSCSMSDCAWQFE